MIDYKKNYAMFCKYLKAYIKRDGIDKFIGWLGTTDASVAPASTRYHLSEVGGLVQHSLNVFNRLISLIQYEYGDFEKCPYSKESIALVALLHDVSKINFYERTSRNVKVYTPDGKQFDELGKFNWEAQLSYKTREDCDRFIYATHAENSVYMLQQFFKLSYDEALAIRWHGGCDVSSDNANQGRMMGAYQMSPLALLLHTADMLATCVDEIPQPDLVTEESSVTKKEWVAPIIEITNINKNLESANDCNKNDQNTAEVLNERQNFVESTGEVEDAPF